MKESTKEAGMWFLAVVLSLFALAFFAQAQEQTEPQAEPPSWAAKLNEAINDKTGMTLTAEETVALAQAYAAALNARPGDIAVSNRACYVLGLDGTVLLSVPLRKDSP